MEECEWLQVFFIRLSFAFSTRNKMPVDHIEAAANRDEIPRADENQQQDVQSEQCSHASNGSTLEPENDSAGGVIRCKWSACGTELIADDLLPHLVTQHLVNRSQNEVNEVVMVCRWDRCETPQVGSSQVRSKNIFYHQLVYARTDLNSFTAHGAPMPVASGPYGELQKSSL